MIKQKGQILVIVLVTLGIVLFTVLFIIAGAQVYFQNSFYLLQAEKASALAEAGIDKALNSLNKTGGVYNGEAETFLGEGSYSVTVTNKDAAIKQLTVTGYIPNKAEAKVKRTIKIQAGKGIGVAFNYGLQVGGGGLNMGNGATLNGSIYSNGNVSGGNNTTVTGDVYVAGGTQAVPDAQSDCTGINCLDYIFGKNVSGESRQDVAQSFKPSGANILNKVSLKIKKSGSPSNPAVRIMKDDNGKPDKDGILATGVLSANLVSTEYSFADVGFDLTPALDAGVAYWIMVHAQGMDNSNYWHWSSDLARGYNNGSPKWSSDWQEHTPSWTNISGDLGFQTFTGGVVTSLDLGGGSQVSGNVHANTITGNMTVGGDAYYRTLGPQVSVQGSAYPDSEDPVPAVFPISGANITQWETAAADPAAGGGVSAGDVTGANGCSMTLGPRKIAGNISLGNGCTVTVKTPLWITGNITAGNTTTFVLDPSYGASSGVIIVNGATGFGNGSDLRGSGSAGSYLMLLSTYDSTQNGEEAVDVGNSSISGIVYAPYGKIELANGASFKEIMAWQIELGNNAALNYDSGLASTVFSSGPSGAYSLVKGTYQSK